MSEPTVVRLAAEGGVILEAWDGRRFEVDGSIQYRAQDMTVTLSAREIPNRRDALERQLKELRGRLEEIDALKGDKQDELEKLKYSGEKVRREFQRTLNDLFVEKAFGPNVLRRDFSR